MKDIIILGMGRSRLDCPFDSETWGVNNGYHQIPFFYRQRNEDKVAKLTQYFAENPDNLEVKYQLEEAQWELDRPQGRLDKLFICHKGQEFDGAGDAIFDFKELNALTAIGIEIISLFDVREIEKKTLLPMEDMFQKFGSKYYSDSIAWMLAYALYLNTSKQGNGSLVLNEPMRVRFYGVDMYSSDEYATERGGIEFFIGMAKAIGVNVWIHPESALCKTTTGMPYGFFDMSEAKKAADPLDIMKYQDSIEGLRILLAKGIIDKQTFGKMKCTLEKQPKLT